MKKKTSKKSPVQDAVLRMLRDGAPSLRSIAIALGKQECQIRVAAMSLASRGLVVMVPGDTHSQNRWRAAQ